MLGKAQADTLGHFNVAARTLFHTHNLTLVKGLGTEIDNAAIETTCHECIVHADIDNIDNGYIDHEHEHCKKEGRQVE